MPHRTILTERQRTELLKIPTDEHTLLRYYTLNDEDLDNIKYRRRPQNKLGFALQLCVLRYPGRLLQPGELIPREALSFIGAQIGLSGEDLADYAGREETRYEHSTLLQSLYGFHSFEGKCRWDICNWLQQEAEQARSNEGLAQSFLEECRRRQVIIPASSTLERLCADALVAAENRISKRISQRLNDQQRQSLLSLLSDTTDGRLTRFVWLRQFEVGDNSSEINRLMDRLEWIEKLGITDDVVEDIPFHRVSQLRRQGERYYADGLRDLPNERKLAILAVCIIEWQFMLNDALIETHDRITGKLYRSCERICQVQVESNKHAVQKTLKAFGQLGSSLLLEKEGSGNLERAVGKTCSWQELESLVELANALTKKISIDPLDFITTGYNRFRRYMPRFLNITKIQGKPSVRRLIFSIQQLQRLNNPEIMEKNLRFNLSFARLKWQQNHQAKKNDRKFWELSIYFAIRDGFRSGDIWLKKSRRHRSLSVDLIPTKDIEKAGKLKVPLEAAEWIEERKQVLHDFFECVGRAAKSGQLPNGIIQDGQLRLEKLKADVPSGADEFILDLYRHIPSHRITDILQEVDQEIGFTDAFTNLRTGVPCKDKLGLLNVILADGINLGLKKMSEATNTHSFWQLLRIAQWHVQDDAYNQALTMIIEAQSKLPMAQFWGDGTTSSSDGQFFPAGGTGEAMNVINSKYSKEPGLKAYSHFSDQFGPYYVQNIPSTVSEAPYILDGLVLNEGGQRIKEHYTDTGGFTDHVFAMCSILGYRFSPRIRGLSQKRLYAFDPKSVHKTLQPLIARKIRTDLIERNWPDVLRVSASAGSGKVAPSQILRKLASYSQQNDLALALREIGRIERTIFILSWVLDVDLQRRVQLGLNKGEAHHALKRAISFNRRGEIRDRTSEAQSSRMAGLNLLTAIIIYWNTVKLGEVISKLQKQGQTIPDELLRHVSPLGWEHIILTGEYRWKKS